METIRVQLPEDTEIALGILTVKYGHIEAVPKDELDVFLQAHGDALTRSLLAAKLRHS